MQTILHTIFTHLPHCTVYVPSNPGQPAKLAKCAHYILWWAWSKLAFRETHVQPPLVTIHSILMYVSLTFSFQFLLS